MLKENEKRMLRAIKEAANGEKEIEISSLEIPVTYVKTRYIAKKVEFTPSRNARLHTIEKLVKDGYIKVDYSNRVHPKIILKSKKEQGVI